MSISPGYTSSEIREYVYAYEQVPYGQKVKWVEDKPFSMRQLYRWRHALFSGSLDWGLIPRDGSGMSPPARRHQVARDAAQAREQATEKSLAEKDAEIEHQAARIRDLEGANEALGKAIGLLHSLNEQEPNTDPGNTRPDS